MYGSPLLQGPQAHPVGEGRRLTSQVAGRSTAHHNREGRMHGSLLTTTSSKGQVALARLTIRAGRINGSPL